MEALLGSGMVRLIQFGQSSDGPTTMTEFLPLEFITKLMDRYFGLPIGLCAPAASGRSRNDASMFLDYLGIASLGSEAAQHLQLITRVHMDPMWLSSFQQFVNLVHWYFTKYKQTLKS